MADINKIKKLRELTSASLLDIKKALEATEDDIDKAIKWLRTNGILKAAKKSDRIAAEGIIKIKSDDQSVVILEINSETDFVSNNQLFQDGADKLADAILKSKAHNFDQLKDVIIDNNFKLEDFINHLTSIIGEKITLRRFSLFDKKDLEEKGYKYQYYLHSNSKIGVLIFGKDLEDDLLKGIAMHIAALNPEYKSLDQIPESKFKEEKEIAQKELKDQLANKPEQIKEKIIAGKINKNLSELTLLEQVFVKDNSKKIKDVLGKGTIKEFVYYKVGEGIEKKKEDFAEEVSKQLSKK